MFGFYLFPVIYQTCGEVCYKGFLFICLFYDPNNNLVKQVNWRTIEQP